VSLAPWGRAVLRLVRSGLWGALVVAAFVLLGTAGAAGPLFDAAGDDAALRSVLAAVPPGAQSADAAVVTVVSGPGPTAPLGKGLFDALGGVEGVGDALVIGRSVGAELLPRGTVTPVVAVGDRVERGRLVAIEDPAARLVPVERAQDVTGGVWLPEPLADRLGVAPGDVLEIGSDSWSGPIARAPARVAAVYRTGVDGRRPADPPGTDRWSASTSGLPEDTEFTTLSAFLVVGDVPVVERLAKEAGDTLLWSATAALDPAEPTLADARRTAQDVALLDSRAAEAGARDPEAVRPDVVSGVPDLVEAADQLALETRRGTAGLSRAGALLALGVVLALAVVGVGRRAVELRAHAATGQHPLVTAAQAGLELLPVVLLAPVVGVLLARQAVRTVGPGPVPAGVVIEEALPAAALVTAVGLLLVTVATLVAAVAAARPYAAGAPSRRVPWVPLLAVAALTAAAGVLLSPQDRRATGLLDVLAPVLVVAAVAAAGAAGLTALVRALAARGRTAHGPRALVLALAARRFAGRAGERHGVLTLMAGGWGLLLLALSASAGVSTSVDDKAAVLAGTEARARIVGSWQLDPGAPSLPPLPDDGSLPPPPPPVSSPRLPEGAALVWTRRVSFTTTAAYPQLMVVDPETFDAAALWGSSDRMAQVRALLVGLAAADREARAQIEKGLTATPVPVLVVGRPEVRTGDLVTLDAPLLRLGAKVFATPAAFPGLDEQGTLVVAPAGSVFAAVGRDDPRYRPSGTLRQDPDYATWVWSRDGLPGVRAVIDPAGAPALDVVTADETALRPRLVAADRAAGYRTALGVVAAALAALVLCLAVDRELARGRAEDVLLARAGLGRRGIRRARAVGTAGLVLGGAVVAVPAAWAGLLVAERLLDPDPRLMPAIEVAPASGALLAVAGAAAAAWLAASAVVLRRTSVDDAAEVLRDAR
jgi:hypothetical protein